MFYSPLEIKDTGSLEEEWLRNQSLSDSLRKQESDVHRNSYSGFWTSTKLREKKCWFYQVVSHMHYLDTLQSFGLF